MRNLSAPSIFICVLLLGTVASWGQAEGRRTEIVVGRQDAAYKAWTRHSANLRQLLAEAASDAQCPSIMHQHRVGTATLGARGELLIMPPMPLAQWGKPAHWIVPFRERLAIVELDGRDLVPIILLSDTWQMRLTEDCPPEFAKYFVSKPWPLRGLRAKTMVGKEPFFILPKEYSRMTMRAWMRRKPDNTVGHYFLDIYGQLRGLDAVAPIPNVVWVVRRDDKGLDLIHSGPAKSGRYLEVGADRVVHFIDPDARSWTGDVSGVRWPYVDKDTGFPAFLGRDWNSFHEESNRETRRIFKDESEIVWCP